jgi:hypothetical protein
MSDTLGKVLPSADSIRENELRKLQGFLRSNGLIFSFSHHYLCHKSNIRDVSDDAQRAVELLGQYGVIMRIVPGIFENEKFALKSKEGLILQKLQTNLRIFFRANR